MFELHSLVTKSLPRIFWQNGTGGLLTHPDFFYVVAENVKIICAEILSLEPHRICLKSGEEIPCEAILCGTGWTPSLQFFSRDQLVELGLPHARSDESATEQQTWADLEAAADKEVVSRFPQLADPPPHYQKPATKTPYRLYNLIAPLSDIGTERSIVFIGHLTVGNYFRGVEAQSIWATAYLDDKLKLPSAADRQNEVALHTVWCRRRYLSNGEQGIFITFDLLGYADRLLKQLGLNSHRRGWFQYWFSPCKQSDFKGLKVEYLKKYESQASVGLATNGVKNAEV